MTKGQVEAKISEAVSRFESTYMGRGPKQIKTIIVEDMIIIRLKDFLNQLEQKLAEDNQCVNLLKKVRISLFEMAVEYLKDMIKDVIDVNILSAHSDVSTTTGEKVIIVIVDENLEERFENKTKL